MTIVLVLALGAVSCGEEPRGTPGTSQTATSLPSEAQRSETLPSETLPSETQPPEAQPSDSEDPLTDPVPSPTGKQAGTTTVTGVLAAGVEAGCLLLDTGSETLLLLGVSPADAREGTRVRVTGSRSPGTATTCQQGVPFRVTRILPFQ